jgi:hypothetical protein
MDIAKKEEVCWQEKAFEEQVVHPGMELSIEIAGFPC